MHAEYQPLFVPVCKPLIRDSSVLASRASFSIRTFSHMSGAWHSTTTCTPHYHTSPIPILPVKTSPIRVRERLSPTETVCVQTRTKGGWYLVDSVLCSTHDAALAVPAALCISYGFTHAVPDPVRTP